MSVDAGYLDDLAALLAACDLADRVRSSVSALLLARGVPPAGAARQAERCAEQALRRTYGASQEVVADELGVEVRTLRRDQELIVASGVLGVDCEAA